MNSIDRFKKSYYINKYKRGGTIEDLKVSSRIYQKGGDIEDDRDEYGIGNVVLDMTPVVGTYRAYNRFREDPDFDTGAELIISGLSDALLPFGIGGIVRAARFAKAVKAAKNMRKLYQYDKARRNADLGLAAADIVAVPLTKTFVVPWDRYFREDDME